MILKALPSPNFDERTAPVEMLVLHYTGMQTAQGAMDKLTDPTPGKRVSAHYLVDEDGTVYALVPEDKRAWHAGVSSWRAQAEVNARSIGIEIVNPGHEYGYRPFPPAQIAAVTELAQGILARYAIPAWNVVAHSDIAPLRKQDPGELFPWAQLAAAGVGLWPQPGAAAAENAQDIGALQADLAKLGYAAPQCGAYGEETRAVVTAFQRHFRPEKVNGAWDADCHARLNDLLARIPSATLGAPDGRTAADLHIRS